MTRAPRPVAVGRAIAAAAILPALVLARRPADEIEDPARLQQRKDKQQDARDAHESWIARGVMWSEATGADVMKRIAAPSVGGLVTSFVLELTVYPAIFARWKSRDLRELATRCHPGAAHRLRGIGMIW